MNIIESGYLIFMVAAQLYHNSRDRSSCLVRRINRHDWRGFNCSFGKYRSWRLNVAVQRTFYSRLEISLLLGESDASRTTIRVRINNGMTNSAAIYPLGRALMDVQDYALAGSLPEAAGV